MTLWLNLNEFESATEEKNFTVVDLSESFQPTSTHRHGYYFPFFGQAGFIDN